MITMTTVWLLLLVVVSSSRIVDSQSTTDNETCSEEPICRPMLEKLLYDQHQLRQRVPQLVHQHRFDTFFPVDECRYNNGGCTQICVDTYDSYYCTCRPGYRLAVNDYTCPADAFCRYSRFGGYQCFCPWGPGDIRPMNGTNCVDINECTMQNGHCSQICDNHIGSYQCSCNTGFRLSQDARTCVDVNECSNPQICLRGTCVNTFGSYFCLSDTAIVPTALKEKQRVKSSTGYSYSGTTVILAATLSALVVFLTTGVVALVIRQLRRHRQAKQPSRPPPVNISQVSAPGFETVRSKCSTGLETDDEPQPTQ